MTAPGSLRRALAAAIKLGEHNAAAARLYHRRSAELTKVLRRLLSAPASPAAASAARRTLEENREK